MTNRVKKLRPYFFQCSTATCRKSQCLAMTHHHDTAEILDRFHLKFVLCCVFFDNLRFISLFYYTIIPHPSLSNLYIPLPIHIYYVIRPAGHWVWCLQAQWAMLTLPTRHPSLGCDHSQFQSFLLHRWKGAQHPSGSRKTSSLLCMVWYGMVCEFDILACPIHKHYIQ